MGRLQHVLHLHQLSLVVLHVLDEGASGDIDTEDLLVDELFGEVLPEEGGEGGGGDVLGGEAEDLADLIARIKLRVPRILEGRVVSRIGSVRESGRRWIIRRARNIRESLYILLSQAIPRRRLELRYLRTSRTNSSSCSLIHL